MYSKYRTTEHLNTHPIQRGSQITYTRMYACKVQFREGPRLRTHVCMYACKVQFREGPRLRTHVCMYVCMKGSV